MITSRIQVEPYVAEYIMGKYYDSEVGAVRFPPTSDIYLLIYDLMSRRPDNARETGNLRLALPDRREANLAGGKSPEYYNWFSEKSGRILSNRLKREMWAEVHDYMMDQKHIHGIQFKESAWRFLVKYGIESITEDALIKNCYRWREKSRQHNSNKKSTKF
ncbi:MAG: hypothetical protein NC311_13150 [Muribaculaceae bacterium]|nr:hypothetical protein [Muribaculaceae bacterium]